MKRINQEPGRAGLLIAVVLWFVFGSPKTDVAIWFWSDDAAPWESVDAFYYPSSSDLSVFDAEYGLESVDDCRSWVRDAALSKGDAGIVRGEGITERVSAGTIELFAAEGLRQLQTCEPHARESVRTFVEYLRLRGG